MGKNGNGVTASQGTEPKEEMPLTVVVGSSGSGKTTFLEDVQKINRCCYVKQYHTLRPYIEVRVVPNFDPGRLPFWPLYAEKQLEDGERNPSYNPKVCVGGTMAGQFHAGLSGGQRKMMLFELIKQRTDASSGLLIALDEPFAGVTDDFVPFIVAELREMRKKHNLLLVTNDHVKTLTAMADSTITVSAIDRAKVSVDGVAYAREVALHAVANGKQYAHAAGMQDLKFFLRTELINPDVKGVVGFTVFAMGMFAMSFFNSAAGSEALVVVALQIIQFFSINPYLIGLVDWRNTMVEEAQALMHFSVEMNRALKSIIALSLLLAITAAAFGLLQSAVDSLSAAKYWAYMFFDLASLTLPFVCFGLYSSLPLQVVQILSSFPFLLMIFLSTTFSPGAGVPGVKYLRYCFARYYFWCDLPGVKDSHSFCSKRSGS